MSANPGPALVASADTRSGLTPEDSPERDWHWITCAGCGRLTHEKPERTLCVSCRTKAAALSREEKRKHPGRKHESCKQCGRVIVGWDGHPLVAAGAKAATCARCLLAGTGLEVLVNPADTTQTADEFRAEDETPEEGAKLSTRKVGLLRKFIRRICGGRFSGTGDCFADPSGRCVVLAGHHCERLKEAVAEKIGAAPEDVWRAYPTEALHAQAMFYDGPRCEVCETPVGRRKKFCPACLRRRRREQSRGAKKRRKGRPGQALGRPREDAA